MNTSIGQTSARVFLNKPIMVLCLAMASSHSQAEQGFDFTSCHAGVVKMLFADKDVTLRHAEGWGIVMSNQENKLFDNATFHVITTVKTIGKEISETGYIKFMDPDGDMILMETSRTATEHRNKFFHGTGKWTGITGSSKGQRFVFRAQPEGWAAACSRTVGTFQLPNK